MCAVKHIVTINPLQEQPEVFTAPRKGWRFSYPLYWQHIHHVSKQAHARTHTHNSDVFENLTVPNCRQVLVGLLEAKVACFQDVRVEMKDITSA